MAADGGVSGVDDGEIFPDGFGTVIVYLDKEALLARLTADQRSARKQAVVDLMQASLRLSEFRESARKQAVVDRFFELSGDRSYYMTDAYVIADVVSAFRSTRGAHEAVALYEDIKQSDLAVQHGADSWESRDLSKSPRDVSDAAAEFIDGYPKHDVSLQEAVLVLQAKRGDDWLFSFDGALRTLGHACDLTVLPFTEQVYLD